jgi:plasmid maintenance system killer protein
MKISYRNKKLGKTVKDATAIKQNYGANAKKINQRTEELKSAPTLHDIHKMPQARCHELTNNRKGQLAVTISANERIIFIPDNEPIPYKEDGGIDWKKITRIKILEIGVDYH